ncbi:MAG: DEAD/DEAH box helicase [Mariprofundaceae bacterium]
MGDLPDITEKLIVKWVGKTYAKRGEVYFEQEKVLETDKMEDQTGLTARVEGTAANPYEVEIVFAEKKTIKSRCSCPVGEKCKHVAAALYDLMEDQHFASVEVEAAPVAFGQWLGVLGKMERGERVSNEYPDKVKQRVLYLLKPRSAHTVSLSIVTARILKDGRYGKETAYNPSNVLSASKPQYILPQDERILREIALDGSISLLAGYQLKGDVGLKMLKRILGTGRCLWMNKDSVALKQGQARKGLWRWQHDADGTPLLGLEMETGRIRLIPTSPPWYVDTDTGACGKVDSGQPPEMAEILLNMQPLDINASEEDIQDMLAELPKGIPAPVNMQQEERQIQMLPKLRLKSVEKPLQILSKTQRYLHIAELIFDYDGMELAYDSSKATFVRKVKQDGVIDYIRSFPDEEKALQSIGTTGLYPAHEHKDIASSKVPSSWFVLDFESEWLGWMMHEQAALKEAGFEIEIDPEFQYKVEQASSWELNASQSNGSGSSGNSLMGHAQFTVTLDDGSEVDLIEALARWVGQQPELLQKEALANLRKQENVAIPLPEGRILAANGTMVANILHYMLDLFAGNTKEAVISAPQLLALEKSFEETPIPVTVNAGAWLEKMRHLVDVQSIPECETPKGLQAELRDYQSEGLNWLQFLRQMGLNGVLADDMGLGKTVQTLAHILKEKEDGRLNAPALVIAPTSLMHNWRREAERFAPDLSVLVLHGPERADHFDTIYEYDLVLTTYPLLVRDMETLQKQAYHLLILDEAHYIKNPQAKVSKLVRALEANHRLCLTGTPMENHLGELWSLFDFLMPGYLHDQRNFTTMFRKPIEKDGDEARQLALNVRIRPFLIRRSKEEVASELPPKTEMLRSIEIEGGQRELYESVRLAMQKKVRDAVDAMGANKSRIIVLDALMKMRQVCCDPRLLKQDMPNGAPPSAKLAMLRDMLPEMVEEGRRILLFSQFTGMLKLIEAELKDMGIDYVQLTGSTKDRATPVDRFQNEKVPVFLISLKAGGVGLNLTAADTVIHYDPWWNPAAENQATDRAHRIGQDKPVFVYKLITEGTVEESILEMQARKLALAEGIYGKKGDAGAPMWSPEDIEALFQPL